MVNKNPKNPKKITLDDLAVMVQNGFSEMNEKFDKRFNSVDKRFEHVDRRFDAVEKRLDRIENILLAGHERRIERMEDTMLIVKNKLKIK